MDTHNNTPATTRAGDEPRDEQAPELPATDRETQTERAVKYLQHDATSGARVFREVAYVAATLGQDAATVHMLYCLIRNGVVTSADVDTREIYWRVFSPITPPKAR